jgi:hypothetical protein
MKQGMGMHDQPNHYSPDHFGIAQTQEMGVIQNTMKIEGEDQVQIPNGRSTPGSIVHSSSLSASKRW